jgi:anti-anti-sigma regulatory factor
MALSERLPGGLSAGASGSLGSVERVVVSLRTCIVTLRGEHDVRMRDAVFEALSRTTYVPRLLIDLTLCTFIDSAMLATLTRCRRVGSRPVVPEDGGQVSRTIKLAGIEAFLLLHGSLEDALAHEPSMPWAPR